MKREYGLKTICQKNPELLSKWSEIKTDHHRECCTKSGEMPDVLRLRRYETLADKQKATSKHHPALLLAMIWTKSGFLDRIGIVPSAIGQSLPI